MLGVLHLRISDEILHHEGSILLSLVSKRKFLSSLSKLWSLAQPNFSQGTNANSKTNDLAYKYLMSHIVIINLPELDTRYCEIPIDG